MVETATLFTDDERFFLRREQIDCFTVPLGDRYDDNIFARYFAVYAGIAQKVKPKRIFEIGVRYGCTAICMALGAADVVDRLLYRGVDDASYGDPHSCEKANVNFREQIPWCDAHCLHHNSFNGLPAEVAALAPFDLIHIDGNHDKHGVLNDLAHCWPALAWDGIIVLDDATTPGIRAAIDEFIERFTVSSEVLLRHQTYDSARGHVLLQKVRR